MTPRPTLTTIEGEGETVAGQEVMDALADVLREHLPLVAPDDVYRPALVAMSYAFGAQDHPPLLAVEDIPDP